MLCTQKDAGCHCATENPCCSFVSRSVKEDGDLHRQARLRCEFVPFIDRQSMRSAALKITWYPMVTYWSAVSEEEGLRWPVGPLRQAFL